MKPPLLSNPRRRLHLWYAPILSLAMGLMLVRTLVLARILDVTAFAAFSAGLLASTTFCMLGCLGLQSMLQRELPMQFVRRRERAGAVLLAQCLMVASVCAAAALIATAAGASAAGLTPGMLAIGVLHGLSQQAFLLATVESRSRGELLLFARQNLWRAVAALAAGAGAGMWFGTAAAVLVVEAVVSMLLTQFALRGLAKRFGLSARRALVVGWRRLPRLRWRSAFALLAVSVVAFALLNADRWVAAELLTPVGFAQYAFAWTVLSIAQSAQSVVNASMFPLLARRCASGGSAVAFSLCAKASTGLLLAGAVFGVPAWWLLDEAVARWFSAYSPARELLGPFVALAVLRLSDFWSSFLMIVGLEARLLAANIVSGLLACAGWLAWVRPWEGSAATLADVLRLALALGAAGYLAAVATAWSSAWHARRS